MPFPVHGLDGHPVEWLAIAVDDPAAKGLTGAKPELDGLHVRRDDHVGQFRGAAWCLGRQGLRSGRDVTEPVAAFRVGGDGG